MAITGSKLSTRGSQLQGKISMFGFNRWACPHSPCLTAVWTLHVDKISRTNIAARIYDDQNELVVRKKLPLLNIRFRTKSCLIRKALGSNLAGFSPEKIGREFAFFLIFFNENSFFAKIFKTL